MAGPTPDALPTDRFAVVAGMQMGGKRNVADEHKEDHLTGQQLHHAGATQKVRNVWCGGGETAGERVGRPG
jgi:hypothetical protein